MIANLLNSLIGLGLTYIAIFGMPANAPAPWILVSLGIAIVVLALIARRSDFSTWQSTTNSVLGIALVIDTVVDLVVPTSPLAVFWLELWIGLTVASLSLWAALYHPKEGVHQPELGR